MIELDFCFLGSYMLVEGIDIEVYGYNWLIIKGRDEVERIY